MAAGRVAARSARDRGRQKPVQLARVTCPRCMGTALRPRPRRKCNDGAACLGPVHPGSAGRTARSSSRPVGASPLRAPLDPPDASLSDDHQARSSCAPRCAGMPSLTTASGGRLHIQHRRASRSYQRVLWSCCHRPVIPYNHAQCRSGTRRSFRDSQPAPCGRVETAAAVGRKGRKNARSSSA